MFSTEHLSSVSDGARVLAGGRAAERPGYFFEGTVVTGVTREMALFSEETFGPVAAVIASSTRARFSRAWSGSSPGAPPGPGADGLQVGELARPGGT